MATKKFCHEIPPPPPPTPFFFVIDVGSGMGKNQDLQHGSGPV